MREGKRWVRLPVVRAPRYITYCAELHVVGAELCEEIECVGG